MSHGCDLQVEEEDRDGTELHAARAMHSDRGGHHRHRHGRVHRNEHRRLARPAPRSILLEQVEQVERVERVEQASAAGWTALAVTELEFNVYEETVEQAWDKTNWEHKRGFERL